ncbi:phloem protein 2-like protein [Artemisia annua]|uniref:Phloem protein 2-like protein n=1 Tax=Artemisia annua TaxID=35608 RepID=A0A2U1NEY5_ARTAN|nr:phloem protein 2-like protein [Artemisia annua]
MCLRLVFQLLNQLLCIVNKIPKENAPFVVSSGIPQEKCWEKVRYPIWCHKYKQSQSQNKQSQFKPKGSSNGAGKFVRVGYFPLYMYRYHFILTYQSIRILFHSPFPLFYLTCRFETSAEMLDISNLNIKIKRKPEFLSPNVDYGVFLVFKFFDSRNFSSKPMYVNLKYKKWNEGQHAYFATWRDKEWMMIELDRYSNQKEDVVFEFLLESFSSYHCGDGAIYVEGIEFRAIEKRKLEISSLWFAQLAGCNLCNFVAWLLWQYMLYHATWLIARMGALKYIFKKTSMWGIAWWQMLLVKLEDIGKLEEVQQVLKFDFSVDQLSTKLKDTFKKYTNHEDLFWFGEVNGKKILMLSAKATIPEFSNANLYRSRRSIHCRFRKVTELLPQPVFYISCTIESQMLTPDTNYVCYIVFKISKICEGLHSPVKVRDLHHQENNETEFFYFITPSPLNINDITQAPKQREDGWMEIQLWKFNSAHELENDSHSINMKFTSQEGTMSGLIYLDIHDIEMPIPFFFIDFYGQFTSNTDVAFEQPQVALPVQNMSSDVAEMLLSAIQCFFFTRWLPFKGSRLCVPLCSLRDSIILESHAGGFAGHSGRDKHLI